MEFTGRLKGISKDMTTGYFLITVSMKRDILQEYEDLSGKEVDVKIVKYKKKKKPECQCIFSCVGIRNG